jgi:hypothetical protein
LFVDTGVWSLALRRDAPPARPEVTALSQAIGSGEPVLTTGFATDRDFRLIARLCPLKLWNF